MRKDQNFDYDSTLMRFWKKKNLKASQKALTQLNESFPKSSVKN
jgi:hypothetical protein